MNLHIYSGSRKVTYYPAEGVWDVIWWVRWTKSNRTLGHLNQCVPTRYDWKHLIVRKEPIELRTMRFCHRKDDCFRCKETEKWEGKVTI